MYSPNVIILTQLQLRLDKHYRLVTNYLTRQS